MSSLSTRPITIGQDLYVASATPGYHYMGEQAVTNDGRKFRYCAVEPSASNVTGQPTGTTLVAGNLLQGAAQIANHLALTPSAASIGAVQIVVTLGATAAYANQYASGYALISTTPGNGIAYRIKSHALVASGAALTANIDDTIQVALTASSRVDLQMNLYRGVLQMPTTATQAAVGFAQWALPALTTGGATGQNYGWIQTHGVCAGLIQSTPAVGASLMPSTTTAGASTTLTAGTPEVGTMLTTGVNGKNNAVYATID